MRTPLDVLAYRWVGVILLVALWWKALTPPSMLRIWIFGLWGLAAFIIFWGWAAYLEDRTENTK